MRSIDRRLFGVEAAQRPGRRAGNAPVAAGTRRRPGRPRPSRPRAEEMVSAAGGGRSWRAGTRRRRATTARRARRPTSELSRVTATWNGAWRLDVDDR